MSYGKCTKCNGKLDMYYGKWCPTCDVPKVETRLMLNLIRVLKHLEVTHPGIKDRLWDDFCDDGRIRNDSFFSFWIEDNTGKERSQFSDDINILFDWLKSQGFKKDQTIIFEVSW